MATESDNVNSGALGTLVAVGTFAMLGISMVVTALVRAEMADELEKKEVSADRPYRDLVAEQTAKLNAPAAFTDRGRGLVSLPIDRAMELTVSGLVKDPNSATPPPPIGGAGGTAATETAGTGGTGGTGGVGGTAADTGGTGASAEGEEKKDGAEPKPEGELKKEDEKKPEGANKEPKKEAPKPKAAPGAPGSPAAPAPVTPTPAPAAPSPAPNGQ
jgi:hypothetical protein